MLFKIIKWNNIKRRLKKCFKYHKINKLIQINNMELRIKHLLYGWQVKVLFHQKSGNTIQIYKIIKDIQ